jgi:hypothetical protein
MATEEVRDFVRRYLDAFPGGKKLRQVVAAGVAEELPERAIRHALHDEEARGGIRLDWDRRYHLEGGTDGE